MSNTKPDSSQIIFKPSATGSVASDVKTKFTETVSVKDFGATGNGTTDDTIFIQNALASFGSGGTLLFPAGVYKVTGALAVTKAVVLKGMGTNASVIKPYGNFTVVSYSGNTSGAGMEDLGFECASANGGYVLSVKDADRTSFRRIIVTNPWDFMFIEHINACYVRDIWVNNIRGSHGIYWYGANEADRSDVLDISNVQLSSGATKTAIGLEINGACNTLSARHIGMVNVKAGLVIRNDTGGSDPQFATVLDLQVDFPAQQGILLSGGFRTGLFTDIYVNGSDSQDGVRIEASVQQISFKGGKIAGNFKTGMYLGGRYIDVSMNVTNNSMEGSALHPGIEIGPESVSVAIMGGTAGLWSGYTSNQQSYGVAISAGAIEYRIIGVTLTGNVLGDYLDTAHYFRSVIFGNIESDSSNVILKTPGTGALKLDNGNMFSITGATAATIPNSPGSATPRRYMKVIGEDNDTYYVPCF